MLRTVIGRAQIILLLWNLQQGRRRMNRMNLSDALAFFRLNPPGASNTIHLVQHILVSVVRPFNVEGHFVRWLTRAKCVYRVSWERQFTMADMLNNIVGSASILRRINTRPNASYVHSSTHSGVWWAGSAVAAAVTSIVCRSEIPGDDFERDVTMPCAYSPRSIWKAAQRNLTRYARDEPAE